MRTSQDHAITFRDTTTAECTKILTDPVVCWTILAVTVLNSILCALGRADIVRLSSVVRLVDLGPLMFAPAYLFLVIPVYAAASEYVSGQNRITLSVTPNRRRLVVGKLASLAVVMIPTSILSVLPGRFILNLAAVPLGEVLLDVARWSVTYFLMGLVAYGLAGLLRSRVSPLAILCLVPLLLATGVIPWPVMVKFLPDQLALNVLGSPGYDVTAMAFVPALGLLATWALALAAAYAAALIRRDS